MDARVRLDEMLRSLLDTRPTAAAFAAYGIAFFFLAYQLLNHYYIPLLSPQELIWNLLVYLLPARFLLGYAKQQELRSTGMLSQTHAAKSEALRKAFGAGGSTIFQKIMGADSKVLPSGMFSTVRQASSDAPPGLGNWDNSCYQNSVLQGISSLASITTYLNQEGTDTRDDTSSTRGALQELITKLNDPANNGKQLWTPAKLKSMSSWTQQDAQEYFSKIMDELDKETAKQTSEMKSKSGLQTAVDKEKTDATETGKRAAKVDHTKADKVALPKNPLEGLLAQRVACTQCGFSEGLSMIPFNCLTVPLGDKSSYNVEECLDEYAKLEEISEVECAKCTLLKARNLFKGCVGTPTEKTESTTEQKVYSLPPALQAVSAKRLEAVEHALENDDFADKTLLETCGISKKAHVSSTKTRQAVIGRAPQSLVIHMNRSVFDERTGIQRKNHAAVQYPLVLDLARWVLDHDVKDEPKHTSAASSTRSLIAESAANPEYRYNLRAVVTHYGRHENGHYIAYRQHPTVTKSKKPTSAEDNDETDEVDQIADTAETAEPAYPAKTAEADEADETIETGVTEDEVAELKWWRLSDDDVDNVSEKEVLRQGGVFMLFYERSDTMESFPLIFGSTIEPTLPPVATSVLIPTQELEDAAAVPLPDETENESAYENVQDMDEELAVPDLIPQPDVSEINGMGSSTAAPAPADEQCEATVPKVPATGAAVPISTLLPVAQSATQAQKPSSTIVEENVIETIPPPPAIQRLPVQPVMRTALGSGATRRLSKGEKGFGGASLRPMAAT